MAMSLGFHIVFAALGVGMPLLMAIAEGLFLRTKNPVYLELCRRWAKGTAILFAVGAVSGTVLSFELGLLWPKFMANAGSIIGMPFSLEGFAFFTEAIFLGVFLYGWNRVPPLVHWLSGLMVAASGMASAVFVVTANAWMNVPTGFKFANGQFSDIDPVVGDVESRQFSRSSTHGPGGDSLPRASWLRRFTLFSDCANRRAPFIAPRWASPWPWRA
jgi:cytochrome bd ubiquinol oxidase subunit I